MNRIQSIISMVCVLAVQVFACFSIDIDGDLLYNIVVAVVALLVLVWGCYKNHNFSKAAQQAQAYLETIKHDNGESRK